MNCPHTWTLFCHGIDFYTLKPNWRVDICVHCYAKRQVVP